MTTASQTQNCHDATLTVVPSMKDITADRWSRLTGTVRNRAGNPYNPFVSHTFLLSLEESGSATREKGWLAQHLLLQGGDGALLGAVPCYLKSHSQGEYVFDHGWADAFERAGGRYYPKLQAAIPFTPVRGPRLLTSADGAEIVARTALAQGLKSLTARLGVSSAHVTFAETQDMTALRECGFLTRTDQQFHFLNRGFRDYDDFLSTLTSRKRKALRKERREARQAGISIEWLSGDDLTEDVWDTFFAFYMDTGSRKWGHPYLNREFFSLIGERMGDDIVLVMAKRAGRYIAGAINFIGTQTLYGRYWGCSEHHRFLHFEVCYHQAIDYAIQHGLGTVEAGAQGEHKLARGYEPVTTYSAHHIAHHGLRRAVAEHLEVERDDVSRINRLLQAHTPFRQEP